MTQLPIQTVLDDLKKALRSHPGAVLHAPAGAGKTTGVPLSLLDEPWLRNRGILVLEPRRLAARAAANRMAAMLGEPVGRTVGYRVRMDSRVGPDTRIEVVTEGVLPRMLQSDPSLESYGLVVFDEFHERHIDTDLGLALCIDIQGVLNESLRLLVMSATLETEPVAALLGGVPVVSCTGQAHPVDTIYLGRRADIPLELDIASATAKAARSESGSILVFLPGAAEIRKTAGLLRQKITDRSWKIAPLYGNLTRAEQDQAIRPAPRGQYKIVLATNIAETSLTIDGIGTVIDSGLMRVPRFDVRSGMTRLVTRTVSRASADQRRGRAGRTGPGVCYRLWTPSFHQTLKDKNRPELLVADLTPLALDLAVWGVADPGSLSWLDIPPAAAFAEARQLLTRLGALDSHGQVTRMGRNMARLPLHPRLARMVLAGRKAGLGAAACELAALIGERDFMRFPAGQANVDLGLRIDRLAAFRQNRIDSGDSGIDLARCKRIVRVADQLCRRLDIASVKSPPNAIGSLLAWAYPDRIAQQRPGRHGHFLLTGGRGAHICAHDPLAAEAYLVAAELDGAPREAKIYLAAAFDPQTLENQFEHRMHRIEVYEWDTGRQAVVAVQKKMLDALTLSVTPLQNPDPEELLVCLLKGIQTEGLACLPWSKSLRRWQQRVLFVRRQDGLTDTWPDVCDAALHSSLAQWLGPYLMGISRLKDLDRARLQSALQNMLDYKLQRRLDELAPTHITVPSGSRLPVDYDNDPPVLAVRIQEMFGLQRPPTIAGGRQALLLHLLSPANRPAQVTSDLAGFWKSGYQAVKKELMGRYPKHYWPEDPLRATPTARAKPRKQTGG